MCRPLGPFAKDIVITSPLPAAPAGTAPAAPASYPVREWARAAARHASPSTGRSVLQLLTTLGPLAALWIAMLAFAVQGVTWAALVLTVPAAAFTVRLFIIQHDCGHRSFFRSAKLNDWLGNLIGILTLTPHGYWRRAHNIHHATCGDLDNRGIGDVSVITVDEYRAKGRLGRIAYRIYRNPAMMLLVGPVYLFVVKYRLPLDLIARHKGSLLGVMGTNAGVAATLAALGLWLGFLEVLTVYAPVIFLSSMAGVLMFYVQHQFERTYWRAHAAWDFHEGAVAGSSYYVLPQPLRWFSGDIGIHHVHHLACRIPNYKLSACLDDLPAMKAVNRIGLIDSLRCLRLALWDEAAQRLIPFKTLKDLPAAA